MDAADIAALAVVSTAIALLLRGGYLAILGAILLATTILVTAILARRVWRRR